MKYLCQRQAEIQAFLKDRRKSFLERCSPKKLNHQYIKNRYHSREKRNNYEVERAWDEINSKLIDCLMASFSENQKFRKYIFQVLEDRADKVSTLLINGDMDFESEILLQNLQSIKACYDDASTIKENIREHKSAREEEREFMFIQLIVEMMDALENREMNQNKKQQPE